MSNKILDDMRDVMRRRHYSIRTERSYCGWVKRFILHFNMKSHDDLSEGEKKIETYLTFLARDRSFCVCHFQGNYKENERVSQASQFRPQFPWLNKINLSLFLTTDYLPSKCFSIAFRPPSISLSFLSSVMSNSIVPYVFAGTRQIKSSLAAINCLS